jgi:hypothetical protein
MLRGQGYYAVGASHVYMIDAASAHIARRKKARKMLFKRTSRAIGDYAKTQPGPKEIGWPRYLLQTFVIALVFTVVLGGTSALIGLFLRWAMSMSK